MATLLAFSVALVVGVLISDVAHRSILSTAVLFLVAGVVAHATGALDIGPGDPLVSEIAVFALFSVLFTDGMRVGLSDLRGAWRLPGRVLVFGMPITAAATAGLAKLLTSLPWEQCFLVGAALSPTDPVFAAAIVGRSEVPGRIRHLLNVESGLNDGLALPVVIVLLAGIRGGGASPVTVVGDLALGVVVGAVLPLAIAALDRIPGLAASARYRPLAAVAVGLAVLSVSDLTGANEFLGAFVAGSVMATTAPQMRKAFGEFGELIAELLKLAALLVFGALLTWPLLARTGAGGVVFAVGALVVIRPLAVGVSLFGSGVRGWELLTVAWFGPKGFASVVYGLLILHAAVPGAVQMFDLVAVTVGLSILAHSSTDVVIARLFERARAAERATGVFDDHQEGDRSAHEPPNRRPS